MKKPLLKVDWLESWKLSYKYDLLEIYNAKSNLGYSYAYANRFQWVINAVKQFVPVEGKILDVAAAQGNFSLALAEKGYEIIWNDIRKELIKYVKLKWEKGIVHFVPGNIFEINFDFLFDAVLITEIIEHVAHPDEFLENIARLIKPEGFIIMTSPNGEFFRNKLPKFTECANPSTYEKVQFKPNADGHIFLLHLDEIEQFAKRLKLEVVELKLISNPLTSGFIKLGPLLKFLPKKMIFAFERVMQALPLFIKKKLMVCTCVVFRRQKI